MFVIFTPRKNVEALMFTFCILFLQYIFKDFFNFYIASI